MEVTTWPDDYYCGGSFKLTLCMNHLKDSRWLEEEEEEEVEVKIKKGKGILHFVSGNV